MGVFNIGEPGAVTVNGEPYELRRLDALYIGRGNRKIVFSGNDPAHPAEFYLLSYPAHATNPTTLIHSTEQSKTTLGAPETANLEVTREDHSFTFERFSAKDKQLR